MRISDWSSDVCSSDLFDLECCGALAILSTDFLAAQARRFLSVATFWKLVAAIECRVVPPLALDHLPDKAARELIQFFAVNRLDATVVTGNIAKLEIGRASCRERVWQYV